MLSRRLRLAVGREDGFTLIELLFGLLLLGVVVAAWSGLMTTTVRSSSRTQELSNLQTEVRAVVDTIASDLRQAQCFDSSTPPITTAGPTELTFYSPDRGTPYHLRQVSYQVVSGDLNRRFATSANGGGPPWTMGAFTAWGKQLGSIVNTTVFTYKDAGGSPTTTPSEVASANVTLTVGPAWLGGETTSYQTNVNLRTATCD